MPTIVQALNKAEVEITNRSGETDLVGIALGYGGSGKGGKLQIPPGGMQKFPGFGHLFVESPETGIRFGIRNTCELPVAVYLETPDSRTEQPLLLPGQDRQFDLARGQQYYLLPRADAYVPPPPMIVDARYQRNNPIVDADNDVIIRWRYPMDHMDRIVGFNHYRAVYDGNFPLEGGCLNSQPVPGDFFVVRDWIQFPDQNIRYAVTAVSRDGVESMFSRVFILDKMIFHRLTDAGFIPL